MAIKSKQQAKKDVTEAVEEIKEVIERFSKEKHQMNQEEREYALGHIAVLKFFIDVNYEIAYEKKCELKFW